MIRFLLWHDWCKQCKPSFDRALVGLPFAAFAVLEREIAAKAYERAAADKLDIAEIITHVGLALFPDESSLL